jgi:hypothetical protein
LVRGKVLRLTTDAVSARPVVVKPLVLLAAKVMGPGPLRLKMVKLAHELTIAASPARPLSDACRGASAGMGTPVEGGVSTTYERL